MQAALKQKLEQLNTVVEQYPALLPGLMFVGGFFFDLITLNRIDEWFGILSQGIYLSACVLLLGSQFFRFEYDNPSRPKLTKLLSFRTEALHFAFGALLSAYAIFYFKSSSFSVSFLFLMSMVSLLLINEVPYFQKLGLGVKSALLALCVFSFFAYVIPIVFGSLGPLIFCLSLAVGCIFLFAKLQVLKKLGVEAEVQRKQMLIPWGLVLVAFLAFYFLKILPPVPLSLKEIGVYHSVEKTADNKYKLSYYKPWWKFWSKASADFEAAPDDKVIVFFRLFAPSNFTEEIRLQWSHRPPSGEWQDYDTIPIRIFGGRGKGFRGYGSKQNFSEGEWKTRVLTSDGREIGRVYFDLEAVNEHSEPAKFIEF
ncbi:MAG: DUF2914 domain-containing protein [Bdellovibrionales bacterium]|nr:DUF2914 domain-containing protein [Bdellovibrionales bacterium]